MPSISASEITPSLGAISTYNLIIASVNPGLEDKKPHLLSLPEYMEKLKSNATLEAENGVNTSSETKERELDELINARVKLAKKQFFINVIECIVSLTSFVVGVGISICSGGVATPIAVIAGLNLMLSLSNLACAGYNVFCAKNNKKELTMGNEAIQQAVFILAKHCQASPNNAKKIARLTSYFIKAGIVVSFGVVGSLIHPVVNNSLCILAKNYAPTITAMMSVLAAGGVGTWMNNDSDAKDAIIAKLVTTEKEVIEKSAILKGKMEILAEIEKYLKKQEKIN